MMWSRFAGNKITVKYYLTDFYSMKGNKKYSREEKGKIAQNILSRHGLKSNPFDNIRNNSLNQLSISSTLLGAGQGIGKGVVTYIFVSPNETEGELTIKKAMKNLHHEGQYVLKLESVEIANILGVEIQISDIIGDWKTGSENSLMTMVKSRISPREAYILASYLGKTANQLSVLLFTVGKNKRDHLYFFKILKKKASIKKIREEFSKNNFPFRSLLISEKSVETITLDANGRQKKEAINIANIFSLNESNIRDLKGISKMIGCNTSREKAQTEFTRHISDRINQNDNKTFYLLEEIHNRYKEQGRFKRIMPEPKYLSDPVFSEKFVSMMGNLMDDDKMTLEKCYKLLGIDKYQYLN